MFFNDRKSSGFLGLNLETNGKVLFIWEFLSVLSQALCWNTG